MKDIVNRTELKRKMGSQKQALIKIASNKKQVYDSIEHIIDKMPCELEKDCARCMISKPIREWHKTEEMTPKPLEDVLIKTDLGFVFVGQYNNGGWLIKTIENDEEILWKYDGQVTEWKVIE